MAPAGRKNAIITLPFTLTSIYLSRRCSMVISSPFTRKSIEVARHKSAARHEYRVWRPVRYRLSMRFQFRDGA